MNKKTCSVQRAAYRVFEHVPGSVVPSKLGSPNALSTLHAARCTLYAVVVEAV